MVDTDDRYPEDKKDKYTEKCRLKSGLGKRGKKKGVHFVTQI